MKKILCILLTIVMAVCLINLNNSHTKAEGNDDVTVTFDMQGHGTQVDAQTFESGGCPEKPDDPSESGYIFCGWYNEATCQTVYDFSTPVTADKTIYAKWDKPFTITATKNGTKVKLAQIGTVSSNLQYTDGVNPWTDYTYDNEITLNKGKSISFKAKSNVALNTNLVNYVTVIVSTGKITASGNIMSLVDTSFSTATEIPGTYCFCKLFDGCTNLTSIEGLVLPATELTYDCYESMFKGCTGLTSLPENLLPATELTDDCYSSMFKGCTGLTSLPEGLLPATTLADYCYSQMFYGCTGLTSLPENLLPAGKNGQGSLAYDCYYLMFCNTGLISLPAGLLPATTLASNCYTHMFEHCTKLTNIPNLPATTLADACYLAMFLSCSSLKISATKVDNYTIPFVINYDESVEIPADGMFAQTGGTFRGKPQSGVTYYVATPTTPTECTGSACSISATKGSNGITVHITGNISPSDVTSITTQGSTLVNGKDYTLYTGSLGVVLTKLYVDSLSVGSHEITINYDDSGTPKIYTLNITISEKPSPSPSKKDESCEKVIGPTWHWNNKKGICEDTGVVKTYTR